VATELIRRRLKVEDQQTALSALLIINAIIVGGLILFGLAQGFMMAVAFISTILVLRRTGAPLYAAWLNKGLPSEIRATVLSMRGQLDAIGQIIGGPIIGLVAVTLGLRAAMIGVGLMLVPAVLLYGRAKKLVARQDRDIV
jgi:DHA3 family tetracycline resistance protein-like MFS transporter